MNDYDVMQLLLSFNDLFFWGLSPTRKDTESSWDGHRTIVTWRPDHNRPEGWFRVKREFL